MSVGKHKLKHKIITCSFVTIFITHAMDHLVKLLENCLVLAQSKRSRIISRWLQIKLLLEKNVAERHNNVDKKKKDVSRFDTKKI